MIASFKGPGMRGPRQGPGIMMCTSKPANPQARWPAYGRAGALPYQSFQGARPFDHSSWSCEASLKVSMHRQNPVCL